MVCLIGKVSFHSTCVTYLGGLYTILLDVRPLLDNQAQVQRHHEDQHERQRLLGQDPARNLHRHDSRPEHHPDQRSNSRHL